ncbi:hypothetical protein ID852_03640 [Xenorhabdus sp. 42]|uniref:hypothetical protein n=1 Tax=Xenorhabdus szentirmaii TaxID=290112 RepID=UPI0019A63E97|nr:MULTISPECIES: hypothetical protein [unclassified Xenorhabdus]MBD2803828.1 hypothetical protein [Xenorhabdus sp. ZM]MBD2819798.1 hypothetical protein [Xenorhabdus sp. 42]
MSQNTASGKTNTDTLADLVKELPIKATKLQEKFAAGAIPQEGDFKDLIRTIYIALTALGLDPDSRTTGNGLQVNQATNKLEVKLATPNSGLKVTENGLAVNTSVVQPKLVNMPNSGISISLDNKISIRYDFFTAMKILAALHGATHYSYTQDVLVLYSNVYRNHWRVYITITIINPTKISRAPILSDYYDNTNIKIDGINLNTLKYNTNGTSVILDIYVDPSWVDIKSRSLTIKMGDDTPLRTGIIHFIHN